MNAAGFTKLLKQVEGLSVDEISRFKAALNDREGQVEGSIVLREREKRVDSCPHCTNQAIVRFGWSCGHQRYRCKACNKTFNALTGTTLARLRWPEKHIENARRMAAGDTVREAAAHLDVSVTTAFRWRHRYLARLAPINPKILSGVVEADETFFLQSFKGQRQGLPRRAKKRGRPAQLRGLSREQIPVLVVKERSTGATLTQQVDSTQAKDIGPVLIPRLSKDAVLVTDGAAAYKKLAGTKGIELKRVPRDPKHRTSGALHLNNVNAYDQRLKSWMVRFVGVATKYLPNYLGWHRWHDANPRARIGRNFLETAFGES